MRKILITTKVLFIAVVLSFIVGCGGGGSNSADSDTTDTTDATGGVNFTFGPNVPLDQQQLVREAVSTGDSIFERYLDTSITSTFNIFLFGDYDLITDAYMAHLDIPADQRPIILAGWTEVCNGRAGSKSDGSVWFFQCTLGNWDEDATNEGLEIQRTKHIFHEHVHTLQLDSNNAPQLPTWINEGMAEYLAFIYTEEAGQNFSLLEQINSIISFLPANPTVLSDHETYENWNAGGPEGYGINIGILGVHVLASRYGLKSLRDYFDTLSAESPWETDFENTFGLSVSQFYSDFAQLRISNFPANDHDFDGIVNSVDTDDDNDGMSDVYEDANGLNKLDLTDTGKDNDGDQLTNKQEHDMGLDPNDPDN